MEKNAFIFEKSYILQSNYRSRDPLELEKCDIVVDVGGVYDVAKNRFDHHQRFFTWVFLYF